MGLEKLADLLSKMNAIGERISETTQLRIGNTVF